MKGSEDGGKGQRCFGRCGGEERTGLDWIGLDRTGQDRTSILIHKMLRGKNKAEE